MDLPLDVILEIASCFAPRDILSLSRVTKEFRAMLMSRNTQFVWRRVLRGVPGLPDCPPDLTEPQYASLVFEQLCWACDSIRASKPFYTLRVRLCATCVRSNVNPVIRTYVHWPANIHIVLPRIVGPYKRNQNELISQDVKSIDNRYWHYYLRPEVELMAEKLSSLQHDEAALKGFINDRQALATALMQHGVAVMLWEQSVIDQKERDGYAMLKRRRKEVRKKMKALGWEERYYPTCDDEDKDLHKWHNFINQRKQLTASAWTAAFPKLEAIYNRCKERQIKADQRASDPKAELQLIFESVSHDSVL